MSKLAILIMIIAAIGMIFGLSKQKAGQTWGKPLAIVCAIVALVVALAQIMTSGGGASAEGIRDRELKYANISAQYLGEYLAENHAGAKAVMIVEPSETEGLKKSEALSKGLEKGVGGAIEIVAIETPSIPADMRPATTPDGSPAPLPPREVWFTAQAFNQIVEKYEGKVDLVVTMMGLPGTQQLGRLNIWGMDDVKLAIGDGSVYELYRQIKNGKIVAAVSYNPDATYDEEMPPRDLEEAFNKRYLLVTPQNVEQLAGKYSGLFANR